MTSGGQGTTGFKWSEKSRDKKRQHCPVDLTTLDADLKELSWIDAAQKYNVACSTIRRWALEFGIQKLPIKQKFNNQIVGKWTEADEVKLLEMYLLGSSLSDIAMCLIRSKTAIVVKLARLKKFHNVKQRRFRNQHIEQFLVHND